MVITSIYLFLNNKDWIHVATLKDLVICCLTSHLGSFYNFWKETGIAMWQFVLPKALENLPSSCTSPFKYNGNLDN